ncbi:hypothetical protein FKF99_23730 [Salmonella enterica]|nr:hypothetical protein [Salmonella enterica]
MRHQKLTEAEECRLGRRAYEETKRRIRTPVLKAILDERAAAIKREKALADAAPSVRTIEHNICYQHPLQPVQRDPDGCLAKPATNHPENRPDRAGFIFTICMVMQPGESCRI